MHLQIASLRRLKLITLINWLPDLSQDNGTNSALPNYVGFPGFHNAGDSRLQLLVRLTGERNSTGSTGLRGMASKLGEMYM